MGMIDFPISFSEISKMREDGDIISLIFSYATIVCIVLSLLFFAAHYLFSCDTFRVMGLISIPLGAIFWFVVYWYRPLFLSNDTRKQKGLLRIRRKKYKAIDKLEGVDFEEAVANLTPQEREGYLDYTDREISTKMMLDWVRRDRKLK